MSDSQQESAYLAATWFLDHDHPRVSAFVAEHTAPAAGARANAVRLFYAVRDAIRYDPYLIRLAPETYKASYVLEAGRGYCVQKGALYAAACRGAGIPARVGYADVRNHLTTERLSALIETDLFIYHGYVQVWLDGAWVKATPVFNRELCERFDVLPLEFDGESDSLFHPFDGAGRRHMEYVNERGTYADVPFEAIRDAMRETYPKYFQRLDEQGDFYAEAAGQSAGDGECAG